ncbi:metal-dependent transcriptional regulator [Desulforudis sp. 1088]|uniref:metal-dependent transcriptional regulator n=1 Tax=unclassified Candidatus Desulforudis TaxID=2635950 RepID=UPI00348C6EA2
MTGYSQAVEDYLEVLYVISMAQKVARVKDVAQAMGVTMPSVVAAVKSMTEKGLVTQEKYGYIELTPKGRAAAQDIYHRHQVLLAFFQDVLALDPATAEQDACRVEHHLSPQARERLLQFVEFIRDCPQGRPEFLERFMAFVKTGGRELCTGCCRKEE